MLVFSQLTLLLLGNAVDKNITYSFSRAWIASLENKIILFSLDIVTHDDDMQALGEEKNSLSVFGQLYISFHLTDNSFSS